MQTRKQIKALKDAIQRTEQRAAHLRAYLKQLQRGHLVTTTQTRNCRVTAPPIP